MGPRRRIATLVASALTLVIATGAAAGSARAQEPAPPSQTPPARPTYNPGEYRNSFRNSRQTWTLQSNTTQTFRMTIQGLDGSPTSGTLWDCWGFDVNGPGVHYAVANLGFYGPVLPVPGHESEPLGGRGGVVVQPDGTLAVPASHAKLTVTQLLGGWQCHAAGWNLTAIGDGLVRPRFRYTDTRLHGQTPAAIASRTRLKRTLRRAAEAQSFTVQRAAVYHRLDGRVDLVMRVKTGTIAPGTTVRSYARVISTEPITPG